MSFAQSFDLFAAPQASVDGGPWGGLPAWLELACEGDWLEARVHGPLTIEKAALAWPCSVPEGALVYHDQWERGYGDLGWERVQPGRVLPWLTAVWGGGSGLGLGVQTGCSSAASWRVEEDRILLELDLRSGPRPLRLGERILTAARVTSLAPEPDEAAFSLLSRLCRRLCPSPRLAGHPVYGANDWYYAYGVNSAEGILADSARTAGWAEGLANRPYSVVDAGWQVRGITHGAPWEPCGQFGDMGKLASQISDLGCRPGIWIRPLLTSESLSPKLLLKNGVLDPSLPEALALVSRDIARCREWGYQLIKHDFSTYDATGLWGSQMTGLDHVPEFAYADDTRTSAEIILNLYTAIREAAGDAILIGCNTVGHLAAGTHELQRTGDDTSGREWHRTRSQGVNSLAFRAPQQGSFFGADADCVGLTREIPWRLNSQWLDLVARSGTPLFVSAAADALGPDQTAALKEAFALASQEQPVAEPIDWMETLTPTHWRMGEEERRYDWDE